MYGSGSENHPDYTLILIFSLVPANCRPSSAVPNQHHVLESSIHCEVNPRGYVSYFVAGDTPITTAADSFFPPPTGDIAKVMHARIRRDAGRI